MVTIKGSIWFSSIQKGIIGIVLTDNGFEEKAYIGFVDGKDQKSDEITISQVGGKFPLKQAKELIGGK